MGYQRDLNELARECHEDSISKGFWEGLKPIDVNIGLMKLMLVTTEVAEAAEVLRDDNDHAWEQHLEEELADIIIRVLDLAEAYQLNIYNGVRQKMAKNLERPMMHGKLA